MSIAFATQEIKKILGRRKSPCFRQILSESDIRNLPLQLREEIAEELTWEMRLRGIENDRYLNEYGLLMDKLIDIVTLKVDTFGPFES